MAHQRPRFSIDDETDEGSEPRRRWSLSDNAQTTPLLTSNRATHTLPSAANGDDAQQRILSVSVPMTVRFTDGTPDTDVTLPSRSTVEAIQRALVQKWPALSGRYLRLIFRGRELRETQQLSELVNAHSQLPLWIHCVVSDTAPTRNPEEDVATEQPAPRLAGFERLRESGLSEEEIQRLREQFHQWRGTTETDDEDDDDDGDEDRRERNHEQRIREEEAWIETNTPMMADDVQQGTYRALLTGMVVGFFGGLISLFWFNENTFTRQQQLGLLAGLMMNLTFGLLHLYY